MADSASPSRRLASVARKATISALAGIAILYLLFLNRRESWSWRIALFGALNGLAIYLCCDVLERTAGRWIRNRGILTGRVAAVPLYFIGGCTGFLIATSVAQAARLVPFRIGWSDLPSSLLIAAGVAIVVGLLFYTFERMQDRLEANIIQLKEKEFAEKELDLARAIQQRLLPPPELEGEGYRISARNLAARFVAGDFYDVFRLADGSLGIVVADVSGKGMGAALIMASVKSILPLLAEGRSPRQMLVELNGKLSRELGPREFVALAFARYEPRTGRFELANAGLPDPYRLRRGSVPEPLEVPGPRLPLGARGIVAYESLQVTLRGGDRVLLLTDGLPEAPAQGGDPLGYPRLAGLLESGTTESPGAFLDRLFASVRAATQSTLEDDWTALLLEASPPPLL